MKTIDEQHNTIDAYRTELDKMRISGVQRGLRIGFVQFDEFYQFKQGYPLQIYGYPYSGKSEILFELLINLSNLYGKKHFLYTPETGEPHEVVALLIEKYIGKPIRMFKDKDVEDLYAMTTTEYEKGYIWVKEHFYVAKTDDFRSDSITLGEVYEYAHSLQDDYWIFDTITIDPWAEIYLDLNKHGGREDRAISEALSTMRKHDAKYGCTTIIVNHINDNKKIFNKETGKMWNPVPHADNISGGKMWFKRGFSMMLVYRPSKEIFNDAFENETWIFMQKIKPRGTGKVGMHKLYWGWKTQRYYELINDVVYFAEKTDFKI
jgi:RecA/RadA recombinase